MTGIKRRCKTHAVFFFVIFFLDFTVILGIKLSRWENLTWHRQKCGRDFFFK